MNIFRVVLLFCLIGASIGQDAPSPTLVIGVSPTLVNCPANMKYEECPTKCPKKCGEPEVTSCSDTSCTPGCVCLDALCLDKDGKCTTEGEEFVELFRDLLENFCSLLGLD